MTFPFVCSRQHVSKFRLRARPRSLACVSMGAMGFMSGTHRIEDLNVQHLFGSYESMVVWHPQFKIPNADISRIGGQPF